MGKRRVNILLRTLSQSGRLVLYDRKYRRVNMIMITANRQVWYILCPIDDTITIVARVGKRIIKSY